MTYLVITIALCIALIFYGILIYNNLIALRNSVLKNWSNIDVLLKQRYSEIPKLVDTVKQYMQFEQETLQNIVKARQNAIDASRVQDITQLGIAETDLQKGLIKLFALAENYPDLKTNKSFLQLQGRISDLENSISDRREFYNDSVNLNNIRIQQFPDVLVAKLFNFKNFDFLKFGTDELKDPKMSSLFKGNS